VLISRMTNDVEALDAARHRQHHDAVHATLTLIGTAVILLTFDVELALLTFLIFPVLASARCVPDRVRRRLPAHARDDRRDHGVPAGDAVGHPRRALVRPGGRTARASPSSTTRTATRT
jgi:ABC-type multidrug transport system fused ATPase/permease subunit